MYVDLVKHLEELAAKLGAESNTYKQTAQAYADHRDLRAYRDHIGVIRLCSAGANPFVDHIDITHRTEEAGSLEVLPYLNDKGVRIYADPPIYVVGYRNPNGFGEVPLHDWEELLKDSEIAPEVIRKVKWFLGHHQPVNYDQVPD